MILSPEASEEEVSSTVERVDSFIADRGGTVANHDNWGVRRLAYPIRKFQEGNYVLARFELNPQATVELNDNLKASEDILRHLVTKV